jgi:hypothetical protein
MSKYPKCPEDRDDCLFIDGIRNTSCLHSPIVYNRKGEPVGGGANVSTHLLHCTICQRNWTCKQTQLEELQNKPRQWDVAKR